MKKENFDRVIVIIKSKIESANYFEIIVSKDSLEELKLKYKNDKTPNHLWFEIILEETNLLFENLYNYCSAEESLSLKFIKQDFIETFENLEPKGGYNFYLLTW